MKTIFDLPAHPLFIHVPIVLLPIAAAGAILLLLRASWRAQAMPVLVATSAVVAASTVLAARSGEKLNAALEDSLGDLAADHQALGETTVWLTLAFLAGAIAVLALQRLGRFSRQDRVQTAALALTSVLGVVATIWMIRTGHEGASIVWDGVLTE